MNSIPLEGCMHVAKHVFGCGTKWVGLNLTLFFRLGPIHFMFGYKGWVGPSLLFGWRNSQGRDGCQSDTVSNSNPWALLVILLFSFFYTRLEEFTGTGWMPI